MIRVTFVAHDGTVREVAGEAGQSLMALAVATGTPGIDGDCGGAMACGTCHVLIAPEWHDRAGAASEYEESLLSVTLDPGPNSRLGCQITLSAELDGLVVHTPASQKA